MNGIVTDTIFADRRKEIERFSFDETVARVFPDMIQRSVPGYSTIIKMIGDFAARYAMPDTVLYDLGCSLGAASFSMAQSVQQHNCKVLAVDSSAAMVNRAKILLKDNDGLQTRIPVEFVKKDIQDMQWDAPASMAVLNFTLQFISPAARKEVLSQVASALVPGGALVLSEKIRLPNARDDALQQSLYYAFKRHNGYSEMEISQKREALEEVLIPETVETHRQRLLQVGFSKVYLWYSCFNFCSMLAIR